MPHWSEKYIGQPYITGEADCAHTLAQIRKEVFGMDVPTDIEVERKASRLGRLGQMCDLVAEYGERTENPQEGDAVLMCCKGRPNHIGAYCVVNGEPSVLHAMEQAGMVVLHRIRDLERVFITVEGYYSWKL
jgi:hypothetical protein